MPQGAGALKISPMRGGNPLLLGAVGLAAFAAAGALVVVSLTGSKATSAPAGTALLGVGDVLNILDGIPQHGVVLGKPSAPVTVAEYADLQCPYCARFNTDELPSFVSRYVRTGKAKLEFRGLAFVGPDSATGLHTVLSAAAQDRLWQVVDILYRNQEAENSGWLSESLIRQVGAAVPGLSLARLLAGRSDPAVASLAQSAAAAAAAGGINSTPTLVVGRSGGTLRRVDSSAAALGRAVDAALVG
ncbi:MAG: DsbA family protein [Gaiellaceae bacterium]